MAHVAQRRTRLSGVHYNTGDIVPDEVVTGHIKRLGLVSVVPDSHLSPEAKAKLSEPAGDGPAEAVGGSDSAPDSDFSGYDFWLSKLDLFKGNFVQAEMVRAFISSDEYRRRFGR